MVYGIWYMVYGIWYMVYGIWYMVYGIWYMVYANFNIQLLKKFPLFLPTKAAKFKQKVRKVFKKEICKQKSLRQI